MSRRAWAVVVGGLSVVGCERNVSGPPRVVWIYPRDGAVNVVREGPFRLEFNEDMDPLSVENSIRLTRASDGAAVPAQVSYCTYCFFTDDLPGATIDRFSLHAGTVYRLTVTGAKDATGEVMSSTVTSQFVTAR